MRVMIALAIGLLIGAEREFRGHPAGLRTMALISAGSCMFTGLGLIPDLPRIVDPTRIAAQIVTGVGFLGAGSILRQGEEVRGLTTAASIWVAASLGMAVGFGYYFVAVFTTVVVIVVLVALKPMEERFFRRRNRRATDPHPDEIAQS
jgi:putative Mg2+ transporter-C (MgtC) family protein